MIKLTERQKDKASLGRLLNTNEVVYDYLAETSTTQKEIEFRESLEEHLAIVLEEISFLNEQIYKIY